MLNYKLKKSLKNKLVFKDTNTNFASYNVGALITFIEES